MKYLLSLFFAVSAMAGATYPLVWDLPDQKDFIVSWNVYKAPFNSTNYVLWTNVPTNSFTCVLTNSARILVRSVNVNEVVSKDGAWVNLPATAGAATTGLKWTSATFTP